MNPIIHAESSVKRWGGKVDQYLLLHEKMDCSKAWISDNRHRALTHTMFWIKEVMIPIFGSYITVGKKKVSVKDICEQHILEDFKMKFIPTPQDFIQEMEFKPWMQNGSGVCPSAAKLYPILMVDIPKDAIQPEASEEIVINKPVIKTPITKRRAPSSMILDGRRNRRNDYESKIFD